MLHVWGDVLDVRKRSARGADVMIEYRIGTGPHLPTPNMPIKYGARRKYLKIQDLVNFYAKYRYRCMVVLSTEEYLVQLYFTCARVIDIFWSIQAACML